jgi:hypothetical protein
MAAILRRWGAAGLVWAVVATSGCNIGALSYFLFAPDDRQPPECQYFASPKQEIKVVFLVSVGTEIRPEFIRVDHDLSEMLVRSLRVKYQEDKATITIVPPSQVENFKDRNPNWQMKNMREVGNYFHADYVVNIDLDQLSLYEPRSLNQFFRGQGAVSVSVFDMRQPAPESKIWSNEFTFLYPTRGPEPVTLDNPNPVQFRSQFLAYMVKELSRCFAPYPRDDRYAFE